MSPLTGIKIDMAYLPLENVLAIQNLSLIFELDKYSILNTLEVLRKSFVIPFKIKLLVLVYVFKCICYSE